VDAPNATAVIAIQTGLSKPATAQTITLPAAPTDWLTAAAVKADAVTKIQAGLSTYAGGDTAGTTALLKSGTVVGADFVFKTVALADAPSGSGLTAQQTADAVFNIAPASTPATGSMGQLVTTLSAGAGTGAWTVIQPVKDSNGVAMQNVAVTMTLSGVPYSALSDASGNATFHIGNGTYAKAGFYPNYTFPGSNTPAIVADVTLVAVVGTAISIAPPAAGSCIGRLLVEDVHGAKAVGVIITFQAKGAGISDGFGYASTPFTETSDANGYVWPDLPPGGVPYRWRRGTGPWMDFSTGADGETFDIPSNAGTP